MPLTIHREPPARITKTTIDAAWRRRTAQTRFIIPDKECRGLALIVNSHSMSWVYSYKPRGTDPTTGKRFPSKSVTIGNPETHPPELARHAASLLKGQTKTGRDPAAERRTAIQKHAKRLGQTAERLPRPLRRSPSKAPQTARQGHPHAQACPRRTRPPSRRPAGHALPRKAHRRYRRP